MYVDPKISSIDIDNMEEGIIMPEPSSINFKNEIMEIIYAMIGGFRYGAKIRLPHAAVTTLLFKSKKSPTQHVRGILKLTLEHAKNLGTFAAFYKSFILVMKILRFHKQVDSRQPIKAGYPEKSVHALVAGAMGGYIVWGKYSSVNHQILLYLSSRVLMGLFNLWRSSDLSSGNQSMKEESLERNRIDWYPYASAIIWGAVMYLFEEAPYTLQPSLKASMDEIYRFIM